MPSALAFLMGFTLLWAPQPEAVVRVRVSADGKPVPGARVDVNGKAAETGADGNVAASAALGPIKVTVRKEGFHEATTSLEPVEAGEWTVEVSLEPETEVREELTVYATRSDMRIQDLPVRVELLQREEIEEKMMMTPGDIVVMLNEMGGMRVQTTSPGLGAASIRMQGMRGRYTRFLADGLPLFGQQGAGLGLLQIPPMDLEQVEVIKGTASALYGAGAMAGVVNLVSRRPRPEPVRELLFNRTALGGTDVTGFAAGMLRKGWSASLLGGGHWQERRDLDRDGWSDVPGYERGLLRPRFYWDGGGGRTALLTGGMTREVRRGGTLPGAVLSATRAPYAEGLGTRRYDTGGSLQWLVGNRYAVAGRFSYSTLRHEHEFGEVLESDRHEVLLGEVTVRGVAGRHTWVAGAAADRDAYRARDVSRFEYTFTAPGVFVQDEFAVAAWLSVSASLRADFHSRYGNFVSPRISGLLRFGGWTARLSAGQGFFASTPLTEETEAAGLSRLYLPAPLRALAGEPFLVPSAAESPALHHLVLSACQRAGFMPIVARQEAVQLLTTLALVESGFGVALIPGSLVERVPQRAVFRPLDERNDHIETGLALLYPAERNKPLLEHFRDAAASAG